VLEPVLEEFAFITPADAGSNLYAVSLKYRINGYTPTGELRDSWQFTGYGTQAAGSLGSRGKEALQRATALAIRDAAARLATELRDQAVIRGLLLGEASQAPAEVVPPGP
jgi:recombinational DNA repair ATPase RecF